MCAAFISISFKTFKVIRSHYRYIKKKILIILLLEEKPASFTMGE